MAARMPGFPEDKHENEMDRALRVESEAYTKLFREHEELKHQLKETQAKLIHLRRAVYSLAFYHEGVSKEEMVCRLIGSIADWKVTEEERQND